MHHTFDICQDIADKLRHPERVCESVQEFVKRGTFISDQWPELSLAESLPGIIAFYGSIHSLFPDQGWDAIAHDYLKIVVDKINEQKISSYSLFEGLLGICFAISICSQKETRYPTLLATSEQLLFREIEFSFLHHIDDLLDTDQEISPQFYNLTHGLSGILAYLLTRKENHTCYRLASACLSRLVRILKRKRVVNGYSLSGWYISPNEQMTSEEKTKYPNGSFSLSLPYGIIGCLSILSLAALEGIVIPEQYEMIQEISTWVRSKQGKLPSSFDIYWHHTQSFEEEIAHAQHPIDIARDIWNYGTPTVARSLYLAAKAMKDTSLMKFAEESFLAVFSKSWQEWHLMGPTFMAGRAGLLALTSVMAQDTGHPLLLKQVKDLENDLKRFYHPSHLFGFQTVSMSAPDQYQWVDHPGLLNGAIGVVLSLLLGHFKQEMDWCRIFLIR